MKQIRQIPLLFPAIFWIIGILAGFWLYQDPSSATVLKYLITLFSLSSLAFLLVRPSRYKLIFLLLLISLTAFMRTALVQYKPANHISHISNDNEQIIQPIQIKITSPPQLRTNQYGTRFQIKGDIVELANIDITGKIILTFPKHFLQDNHEKLIPGTHIRANVSLTPYRQTSGFSRIPQPYFNSNNTPDVLGRALSLVHIVELPINELSYIERLNIYRHRLVNESRLFIIKQIDTRIPQQHQGFIKAILLGQRADMQQERDLLAQAGMAHLLAISGLHLSIITFAIITLLNILYIRRTLAHIITLIFILFYAELCGWPPSVTRATLMISLILITKILQRIPSLNNILLASLIIITAVNPAQVFSIGLQFSFISVLVIINLFPIFKNKISKLDNPTFRKPYLKWTTAKIIDIMLLSALISIFLAPLTLYYFNQFSLNGIFSNILGISLMTLIIPVSLLVILLPGTEVIINAYQNALVFLMETLNNWTSIAASMPLFFNFIPFSYLQVITLYTAMILMVYLINKSTDQSKNKTKSTSSNSKKRLSKNTASTIGYYFAICLLLLITFYPAFFTSAHILRITVFDVTHGDMFLIETPFQERILIDTGPGESHFRRSALPYFMQHGIKEVDWIILTHPHNDHYGGFQWIMNNIEVKNVAVTDHFEQSHVWQEFRQNIDFSNTAIYIVQDTTHISLKSTVTNKIIHPDKDFSSTNYNDMSLVLRLQHHNFSMLFTGDIEYDAEVYLVNKYPSYLNSLILKVAHHGSNTSSTAMFLNKTAADYAIIPAPYGFREHLPHKNVLKRLSYLPSENIYITGKHGSLQIRTDGFTATIKTFLDNKVRSINF